MKVLTPNAKYEFEFPDHILDKKDLEDWKQVIKEAWIENVYQIEKSDFYDTAIFIDIGANIGSVSLQVASMNDELEVGKKRIKVLAYEPEPTNLEYLSKNVKTNNKVGEVRIIGKAVYGVNGIWKITPRGGNSKINKEHGADVDVITLEQVFMDNKIAECDVMKIDVEGSEYTIINSSTVDTLKRIKYLTLEFDGGHEEAFGQMITKLSEVFNLHILGRPSTGGYIYGRRY